MKIVIPGGSGQVGTMLARAFHRDGHEVVVLSRQARVQPWRVVVWDGVELDGWSQEVDGCDAVINLAGRSVNCRYTASNRKEMLASRVLSTRVIGQAVSQARHAPRVWLQASTATIYSHRYDGPNDEATGMVGGQERNAPSSWRFSIEVASAWERAFDELATNRTRKVTLRSAMTMSPDAGGVFDTLLGLVRLGLGGPAGDGRQFASWIHYAPEPLPNADFMRLLREAYGISFGLPASQWMLEVGAVFMRTETELILKSRRVVPGRLLASGFGFEFPTWGRAAQDLCREWRHQS